MEAEKMTTSIAGAAVAGVLRELLTDSADFRATLCVLQEIGSKYYISITRGGHDDWYVSKVNGSEKPDKFDLWPDALRYFLWLLLCAAEAACSDT